MNLLEAVAKADELRPNTISGEMKAEWVFLIEGDVARKMKVDCPDNPFPEDTALLLPHQFGPLYYWYLCMMIDLANEDFAMYNADLTVFNGLWDDYVKAANTEEYSEKERKRKMWRVM